MNMAKLKKQLKELENTIEALEAQYNGLLLGRETRIRKLETEYELVKSLADDARIQECATDAGLTPQEWLNGLVEREIKGDFALLPVARFIAERVQALAVARGVTVESLMTGEKVTRSLAVLIEDDRL